MGKKEFLAKLSRFGIVPDYALGQNFLWDQELIRGLIREACEEPLVNVLEIGAGAGTLSEVLAEEAEKVIALEIDERLSGLLAELAAAQPNLRVIMADAREIDLAGLFSPREKRQLQIMANLPYYITSELIRRCLLALPEASAMHFMVQKDVVPRLRGTAGDGKSKVKNQGSLMKLISCYGELKTHRVLPGARFYPEPRVESQFISLLKREQGEVTALLEERPQDLARTIEQAFSQRRKTLLNCFPDQESKIRIAECLKQQNLPQNVRAEQLNAAEFAALTRALCL